MTCRSESGGSLVAFNVSGIVTGSDVESTLRRATTPSLQDSRNRILLVFDGFVGWESDAVQGLFDAASASPRAEFTAAIVAPESVARPIAVVLSQVTNGPVLYFERSQLNKAVSWLRTI